MLFLLSANGFLISQAMLHWGWFYGAPWQKILQASIGSLSFCSLCFVIISSVKSISGKQIRTLLRLPIIGILLGIYSDYQFILIGFIIIDLFLLIHLYRKREEQLYIFRQQIKGFFGILLFVLATYFNIEALPQVGFLLFLLMNIQIINAIKLKILILSD